MELSWFQWSCHGSNGAVESGGWSCGAVDGAVMVPVELWGAVDGAVEPWMELWGGWSCGELWMELSCFQWSRDMVMVGEARAWKRGVEWGACALGTAAARDARRHSTKDERELGMCTAPGANLLATHTHTCGQMRRTRKLDADEGARRRRGCSTRTRVRPSASEKRGHGGVGGRGRRRRTCRCRLGQRFSYFLRTHVALLLWSRGAVWSCGAVELWTCGQIFLERPARPDRDRLIGLTILFSSFFFLQNPTGSSSVEDGAVELWSCGEKNWNDLRDWTVIGWSG